MEELIALLQREKAIYEELLQVASEKKEVLIKNEVSRLTEMLRVEAERLKALEKINPSIVALLSAVTGREGSAAVSVTDAIHALSDPMEKEALQALQGELRAIIEALRGKNEVNQRLIETQLEYNAFCLELLTQNPSASDIYGSSGRLSEAPVERRGLIDREA